MMFSHNAIPCRIYTYHVIYTPSIYTLKYTSTRQGVFLGGLGGEGFFDSREYVSLSSKYSRSGRFTCAQRTGYFDERVCSAAPALGYLPCRMPGSCPAGECQNISQRLAAFVADTCILHTRLGCGGLVDCFFMASHW